MCGLSDSGRVTLHFPSCPPLPLVHTHRGHASPSSGSSPNPSSCHLALPCAQLFGGENSKPLGTYTWSPRGLWAPGGYVPLAPQSLCHVGRGARVGSLKAQHREWGSSCPALRQFCINVTSREMWSGSQDGVRTCVPQILRSWMSFSLMSSVIKASVPCVAGGKGCTCECVPTRTPWSCREGCKVPVRVCTCFTSIPVPEGAHVKQYTNDRSRERGVRNKGKIYVV